MNTRSSTLRLREHATLTVPLQRNPPSEDFREAGGRRLKMPPQAPSRARSLFRRTVREPFVHFMLLGAALFIVNEYLEERARFTHISVTRDTVRGIAENYRLQYGTIPTPQQLDALVAEFIREEVFYHQALKLGLDRDDEIIRRRLVQKYEFLQQDLGMAREPTPAELRAYFDRHQFRYQLPERVTFSHVYFSPDSRGEQTAQKDAERLGKALSASSATRAPEDGDRFPGPTDFAALTPDELIRVFGKDGLAHEIFSFEPNRWSAPVRSGLGWHLVYVTSRQAAQPARYDEVRETVRRDYLDEFRSRRNAETFAKLKQGFIIDRDEGRP